MFFQDLHCEVPLARIVLQSDEVNRAEASFAELFINIEVFQTESLFFLFFSTCFVFDLICWTATLKHRQRLFKLVLFPSELTLHH